MNFFSPCIVMYVACQTRRPIFRHQLWCVSWMWEHNWCDPVCLKRPAYARYCFPRKFSSFRTNHAATRLMPKIFTKTERADSWEMSRSRAISLKLECRLSNTIAFTFSMFSSVKEVEGRLEQSMSSTTSWPSLNALYHS